MLTNHRRCGISPRPEGFAYYEKKDVKISLHLISLLNKNLSLTHENCKVFFHFPSLNKSELLVFVLFKLLIITSVSVNQRCNSAWAACWSPPVTRFFRLTLLLGKMLKWHESAFQNVIPVIGQLDLTEKKDFVVQGSPPLSENGKLVYEQYRVSDEVADDIGLSRAQRTFVGVDNDGNLLLGIADGRTKSDRGLNLEEMALYMHAKGAVDALNGDGGASTELYIKGKGIVTQNSGAAERVVNHAILIFMKTDVKPVTPVPVLAPTVKYLDGTKDVQVDAWYAAVVKEAMTAGLMSVGDDEKFYPDQPITRAMMAQILSNMKRKGMS